MSGFYIVDFAGMMPRTAARLLEPNRAQDAVNAELFSGELRAFRDLGFVVTPTKVGTKQSIYRFGQDVADEALYWFHWTVDVDVVRGPVNNDAAERTYWTGETEPRVTDNSIALTGGTDYPMAWFKLGVPKPANTPNVAINGVGSGEPRARAYVYTYVSVFGEEGPPSEPSAVIEVQDGQTVDVSNMSTGPGAGYNIVAKRIYRALTGSTATDYQFVAEIAIALTTYNDAIADEALGEVIRSRDWIPPEAGLKGLVNVGNSFFAAFLNNDVWMSEPFLPHAWPVRYRKSTPFGIVSLGSFDRTLVAMTKGEPYAGAAADPSGLILNKIGGGKACVAKRGTVSLPGGVAYPCADGLALVTAAGWSLPTDPYFTRKQWQALVPESFLAARWGQRYVGFYNDGVVQRGFIFDPVDPRAGLIYIDVAPTAAYNDPQRDALYLQVGNDILKWDSGVLVGTAQSGSADSLTLAAHAPAALPANAVLRLAAGPGSVQDRPVSAYDGGTKVATVSPRWRTNLFRRSEEADHANWAKAAGVTVTPNEVNDSDGELTADRITMLAGANRYILQAIVPVPGDTYVVSYEMRAPSTQTIRISFEGDGTGGSGYGYHLVNLTTEWQRFSRTVTVHTGATFLRALLYNFDPSDNNGAGADFWRSKAQIEKQSVVGDYIKTEASAITLPDATTEYEVRDTGVPSNLAIVSRGYTWKSKTFVMPRPINPRFMQVKAATYPVTVKLYADAVLKHTAAVADSRPFALPSGYQATEFEIQAEGTANVKSVAVAESMRELKELVS